jgi:hypothetical protein
MQDVSSGAERVRAWPRKRPGKGSKAQQEQREKFTEAQHMARFLAPAAMAEAMRQVENSPLLPRDFLTMMAFGTMYAARLEDGTEIWPMAARRDVSKSLDILGAEEGMVLKRGPKYWEALPTSNPATNGPYLAVIDMTASYSPGGSGWREIAWQAAENDPLSWFNSATGRLEPTLAGWYMLATRINLSSGTPGVIQSVVAGTPQRTFGNDLPSSPDKAAAFGPVQITSPGQSVTIRSFFNGSPVMSGGGGNNWLALFGPF